MSSIDSLYGVAINTVLYLILFVICNALTPKAFGVSQIKLKQYIIIFIYFKTKVTITNQKT